MARPPSEEALIHILQLAYSGELAAGYAYHGHWRSLTDPVERQAVHKIEDDEWHHRRLVGDLLTRLGAGPSRQREVRANVIGRVLGFLCHVSGWLAPMFGAGKLESRNIREYEVAARYAQESDHSDFIECLLTMAEVEWDHEHYFRGKVLAHPWAARLPLWPEPPPKQSIRAAFPGYGIVEARGA